MAALASLALPAGVTIVLPGLVVLIIIIVILFLIF
jgi:hypothetical protein